MNDDDYYESLGPWLSEKSGAGGILSVEFAGGVRLFPSWQFDADGRVLPGLDRVLETLRPAFVDPASQAGWLAQKAYVGGTRKRWEYLADDVDLVVEWAAEDAGRVTAP